MSEPRLSETLVLVATVTAVFRDEHGHGGEPEAVASALLAHEDVSTVRINTHGSASGYRVDVIGPSLAEVADQATSLAGEVAEALGLTAEIVSVGLLRDHDRTEVFRTGDRGDDLVWGER